MRKSGAHKPSFGGSDEKWIWGIHSVEAALDTCPELILDLQLDSHSVDDVSRKEQADEEGDDPQALAKILTKAQQHSIKVKTVPQLPKSLADKRCQGVVAKIKQFPLVWLKDYLPELEEALDGGVQAQYAILDSIQDPRNYGAILRSAAAFGVQAVFVRDRNQSPLTGVVAQASAGNAFRVTIVSCSSLNPVVEAFSKRDLPIFGLETKSEDISQSAERATDVPLLWILGGEAKGIRHALREKCSKLVSIPMAEGVESLNASAAATLAFFVGMRK